MASAACGQTSRTRSEPGENMRAIPEKYRRAASSEPLVRGRRGRRRSGSATVATGGDEALDEIEAERSGRSPLGMPLNAKAKGVRRIGDGFDQSVG